MIKLIIKQHIKQKLYFKTVDLKKEIKYSFKSSLTFLYTSIFSSSDPVALAGSTKLL